MEKKNSHRPLPNADLTALLNSKDWEELRERMSSLITVFGISDFMLKMNIASLNGNLQCHFFSSLPSAILDLFATDKMDDSDSINRHLAKSSLPLLWEVDQVCALAPGAAAYTKLKSHGIGHGLSMSAYGENVVCRVDFYGLESAPFLASLEQYADAHLFGSYLAEAARILWQKTAPSQARLLSPRELECLHWSASGKTSQEIGQILGISQHTVYFHLKNVATKLNVYGTRHAISRAITIGIIKSKI